MKRESTIAVFAALAMTLTIMSDPTQAHGDAPHVNAPISADEHAFGVQGDPKKATRTVTIAMDDGMRYTPATISVKRGEVVTFAITNKGKLMHELVLGTESELKKHAELMRMHPGMEHDEPYMAHVKPGATEKITWKFTKPGTFLYGCLVAGHFEAGMHGRLTVAAP